MKHHKKKKRKRNSDNTVDTVLGIAWYTQDQWKLLTQVVSDPGNLEDTYGEWLYNAKKALRNYTVPGTKIRRVHIDVDELVTWCKSKNLPVNGTSVQISQAISCMRRWKKTRGGRVMAELLDDKELVTFKEMLITNSIQVYALAQLLIDKGIITRDDYFKKLSDVQQIYQSKTEKT